MYHKQYQSQKHNRKHLPQHYGEPKEQKKKKKNRITWLNSFSILKIIKDAANCGMFKKDHNWYDPTF